MGHIYHRHPRHHLRVDDEHHLTGVRGVDQDHPRLEPFAELGRRAAFGLAEEAVEMAERVEPARVAYLGYRQLGCEQHTRRDPKTVVDEVAVGRATGFVTEETRERVHVHAGHVG